MFCKYQVKGENNTILCSAHMAESRCFICRYKNETERLNSEHPCSDYIKRESVS